MILQCSDKFQTCAVADVCETRITVAAEVSLENFAVFGAIENRSPGFEFSDAVRSFFSVQLGHPPVVQVLTATHEFGHYPGVKNRHWS